MKTVTICGSMRFSDEMKRIAFLLESSFGFNVLQCTYNKSGLALTQQMLQRLENAHLRKIDLSDFVYIVDVDHYIGDSVRMEIDYAREKCKPVLYHSDFPDNLNGLS